MTTDGETPRSAGVRHDRRRVAVNFLTMVSTSGLALLINLLISIYIRRVLGPEAIGQVSWSLALVGYLAILVNPGLTTVGQRELAKAPAGGEKLIAVVVTIQTMLAMIVYGLVVAIAALGLRGETVSILLLIQSITFVLSAVDIGWVLQAHERMAATNIALVVLNALQLPVLFWLIHGPQDIYVYAIATLPFMLAGAAYNLWYIGRHRLARLGALRPTLVGASAVLREAWPLALSQGSILIYTNSDILILGFTDSDDAVGQYASAYKLMLISGAIAAALWNAYFPSLARTSDPAAATSLSREYLAILAWIGLPIAALGWACGRHVVQLLYGARYLQCGLYFEWLCLNIAILFVNYGVVAVLVPWGRSTHYFKITAAAALTNLLLNAVAIPRYGPWGAVATTIAAEFVVLGLGLMYRRRLGIHWHPLLPIVTPPLLCSAAVALTIAALPRSLDHWWWLELAVGTTVLGGCLLAFESRFRQAFQATVRRYQIRL
jgi:O-antigen/teichoic acid export membrane protein